MWKEYALKTVYHFLSQKYHIDFKIIEDVIPKFRCKNMKASIDVSLTQWIMPLIQQFKRFNDGITSKFWYDVFNYLEIDMIFL